MHTTPVLLVSLSGCVPKQKIILRTQKKRISFKGQELRISRWFKANPNVGRLESVLKAKDAKAACRKLKMKLDMKRIPLAAFLMERE